MSTNVVDADSIEFGNAVSNFYRYVDNIGDAAAAGASYELIECIRELEGREEGEE